MFKHYLPYYTRMRDAEETVDGYQSMYAIAQNQRDAAVGKLDRASRVFNTIINSNEHQIKAYMTQIVSKDQTIEQLKMQLSACREQVTELKQQLKHEQSNRKPDPSVELMITQEANRVLQRRVASLNSRLNATHPHSSVTWDGDN